MFVAGVAIFWLSFRVWSALGRRPADADFPWRETRNRPLGHRRDDRVWVHDPTAMTFGPDGALYVSNFGFGAPVRGSGQIVRLVLSD